MITTPRDYYNLYHRIQSENAPSLAVLLPTDEKIYNVDLNARTVEAPEYLSVEKDHRAETIYFKVNRFYDLLGTGMANLVYVFNPEAIVVGGGISKREGLAEILEKYMNSHLSYGFRNTAKVVSATFKNDGGMLGAYYNFLEYVNKNGGE